MLLGLYMLIAAVGASEIGPIVLPPFLEGVLAMELPVLKQAQMAEWRGFF